MLKKNRLLPTVIVTFVNNRIKYLRRLSDYYKNYEGEIFFVGPKFKIDFKISNNINFFYTEESNLFKKILSTKDYIKTEFVVWSPEDDFVSKRYSSFDSGIGAKIESGEIGFEELDEYVHEKGEPDLASGRQEMLENLINDFI